MEKANEESKPKECKCSSYKTVLSKKSTGCFCDLTGCFYQQFIKTT